MPTVYKVLGQVRPSSATATTLYTVPNSTSAVCSTLSICNTGTSTTYRIAIRPSGGAIADIHYIVYESAIEQYDTAMLTLGITLAATDVVTVYSNTANVVFNLFGSEIS
jgi:hypothetical protein